MASPLLRSSFAKASSYAEATKDTSEDFQQGFGGQADNLSIANQINTSIQPVLITIADLDLNSAATSGFSHKMFTHFNHQIHTYGRAQAHIGLGSEVEFGRQAGPPPAIGDDKCINCALSSWGIWLKGSVSW